LEPVFKVSFDLISKKIDFWYKWTVSEFFGSSEHIGEVRKMLHEGFRLIFLQYVYMNVSNEMEAVKRRGVFDSGEDMASEVSTPHI